MLKSGTKKKNMDESNPFSNLFGGDKAPEPMTAPTEPTSAVNVLDQKINGIIEHIFSITLNRTPKKTKQLIFMEELSSAYPSTSLITVDLLEQALFERILMQNPRDYLIPSDTQNDETDAIAEEKVIKYLYRSYERLSKWTRQTNDATITDECNKIKQLILRNASTALKQPDLFENQSLYVQWMELFQNYFDEYECKCEFLSNVITEISIDPEPSFQQNVRDTFDKMFGLCVASLQQSTLITVEKWVIYILKAFVSDKTNAHMAELMLNYTTPKPRGSATTIDGIQYATSLLGSLLSLSIMPKRHDGPYEYYENIADSESSTLTASLWNYLTLHLDEVHGIIKGFLLVGGDIRNRMLEWIGSCLHANAARGQIWNAHNPMAALGAIKTAPDSFMIGLCGVLLRLCKPLLRPTFKVLDVDPTYFAVREMDRIAKGVHMQEVEKETCLTPVTDENEIRHTSNSYNFVTEVFYMTHRAIDLGYRVCIDKFFQMNREMARMQSIYRDIQAQGGSGMMQNMMDALTRQMPKFLCLQKLLIEPNNDQLLLQFYEATSMWITRCAARIPDPQNPENEINPIEFQLPIKTPAPKCLSSIPEFILENIVGYMIFIRHFDQQAIDTDIDAQNSIFTVILTFMGDVNRARNPHLRARFAECLESLLPKKCNAFGCSSKMHLFTQHMYRFEVVPNLLNVFVSIEMTEQKLNYRRPMYTIMEYIWKIDEQRECFKRLAKQALDQMEAVDPPLFLRFVNLLINDAIYLLDESLSNLKQIRQLQNAQDNGEWQNLPAHEREQNLANMQHIGNLARFDNILGRDTINFLKLLTSEVPEMFCHASMVDRIAAMLNYFLLNLVGPKQGEFKVNI